MRPTVRIHGENVGEGDAVVLAWSNAQTVALVGVVGQIEEMFLFDRLTGERVKDPILHVRDHRTKRLIEVKRNDIHTIGLIDGPWATPEEVRSEAGMPEYVDPTCLD